MTITRPTASADASAAARPAPRFTPVPLRPRRDGWTAERQIDFIDALAASGCVEDACRSVGMAPSSAYALRTHAEAASFRQAWDIAVDYAVDRLVDAALSRAIHGVVQPIFYKGEQVGERRRYDERLTQFLLRYRRPELYGAWIDAYVAERDPQALAIQLTRAQGQLADDVFCDEAGLPRIAHRAIPRRRLTTPEREAAAAEDRADRARRARQAREDVEIDAGDARTEAGETGARGDVRGDVVSTSSTSTPAAAPRTHRAAPSIGGLRD